MTNTFKPEFRSAQGKSHRDRFSDLMDVVAKAELVSVFAHNYHSSNGEINYDAPIPMGHYDPSILFDLGVVSKSGDQLSKFGEYVVSRLSLHAGELQDGNLVPVIEAK